jgi:hypothetical protein
LLGGSKAFGVFFQSFDAEEFLADRVFGVPGRSSGVSFEGAKE